MNAGVSNSIFSPGQAPSGELLDWLLEGPAYVRYRTRLDLMGQAPDDPAALEDRAAMLAEPAVRAIVDELAGWPGRPISSHKSAGQLFHKLTFLADLGLDSSDPGVSAIIDRILVLRSPEGPFAIPMSIGEAYGGSGKEEMAWALCDTPLILYALVKLGLAEYPQVKAAGEYLLSLGRTDAGNGRLGWPCAVSSTLGSWRGPGRKDDPCPFATLAMLKAVSQVPEWRDTPEARAGCETLLSLWADSLTRHPYIFYMGTDFRKLKAPFVWYDLLHVLDVLSRFPAIRNDRRLRDMLSLMVSKADTDGRYTPESVWQAWSGWDFGQKKAPSRWLTLLVHRIRLRLSDAGVAR